MPKYPIVPAIAVPKQRDDFQRKELIEGVKQTTMQQTCQDQWQYRELTAKDEQAEAEDAHVPATEHTRQAVRNR